MLGIVYISEALGYFRVLHKLQAMWELCEEGITIDTPDLTESCAPFVMVLYDKEEFYWKKVHFDNSGNRSLFVKGNS